MNIKIFIIVVSILFISGCAPLFPFEDEGEFRTDEEMVNYLLEFYEDFNLLVENRFDCEDYNTDTEQKEYSVLCKELKDKLGLVDISYSSNNDRLLLRTFYYDRKSFWNDYEKGLYYTESSVDESKIWDGDLNTRPQREDCDNYFRLQPIESNEINQGWYIYVSTFCD